MKLIYITLFALVFALSSQSEGTPRLLTPTLNREDIIKSHPKDFGNFKDVDQTVIKDLQKFWVSLPDKNEKTVYQTNCPALKPLLKNLESYLLTFTKHPNVDVQNHALDLVDEIGIHTKPNRLTKQGNITLEWFYDIHTRFHAVFGHTEQEIAAIKPTGLGSVLTVLFENGTWKKPGTFYVPEIYSDELFDVMQHQYLSKSDVEKEIDRYLPPAFFYPMIGKGKVNPSFMVQMYLKGIYPVAYTTKKLGFHGLSEEETRASGMTGHDIVHGFLDTRYKTLVHHILKNVDNFYLKGLQPKRTVKDLMQVYTPFAVQKFFAIHTALQSFYDFLITNVLLKQGPQTYKEIITGFFWFMHEAQGWDEDIYGSKDLSGIMDRMIENSIEDVVKALESPNDPLYTSVLTGESSLNREGMLKALNIDPNEFGLAKITINKSPKTNPMYYEITRHYQDGRYSPTQYLPTLYYKWKNIDDVLGLLGWSGLKIQKPTLHPNMCMMNDPNLAMDTKKIIMKYWFEDCLSDCDEEEDDALIFIGSVQAILIKRLELFRDVFKYFIKEKGVEESFFRYSFKLEQQLNKVLEKVIKL
jgi:hypothetical protein